MAIEARPTRAKASSVATKIVVATAEVAPTVEATIPTSTIVAKARTGRLVLAALTLDVALGVGHHAGHGVATCPSMAA